MGQLLVSACEINAGPSARDQQISVRTDSFSELQQRIGPYDRLKFGVNNNIYSKIYPISPT